MKNVKEAGKIDVTVEAEIFENRINVLFSMGMEENGGNEKTCEKEEAAEKIAKTVANALGGIVKIITKP